VNFSAGRQDHAQALGIAAADFVAFVERLAQVSGDVILPFFRSAIRAEDLMHRGRPIYGMMAQPFIGELYSGDGARSVWRGPAPERGDRARGNRTLRTRACASLAEATLMTTSPLLLGDDDRAKYYRVERQARLTRYGGDCYAYCMLASGFVDVVVEANLKSYDIVALAPIIEGAGGIVTNWEGGPAAEGGRIIASGDRRVHEEAMGLLAK
jgi:myo-inositol-1(or 4)-monophosphatase